MTTTQPMTQPTTRPTVAQSACCQLAPRSEDLLRSLGAGSDGATVPELAQRLRLARTTRVSIEGNGALCRGLLAVRYPQTATG